MNQPILYEPTLFLRDGKMYIKGFAMERPKLKDNDSSEALDNSIELSKYSNSAFEYPVCEESKEKIYNAAAAIGMNQLLYKKYFTVDAALENGIRIEELAHRLEVVGEKCCANSCDWPNCKLPGCLEKDPKTWIKSKIKQIRLLPEQKEETIIINGNEVSEKDWNGFLEWKKQQFTIKRNK